MQRLSWNVVTLKIPGFIQVCLMLWEICVW